MKILIVDDSATMRKIIRRNLRQAGYDPTDVLEAGDGAEALTVLEGNTVDIIFSDVNMPNMNGVEFLDKVKASDATSKIPVIMITTESTKEAVFEFTSHGASGCVAKPFTADQLGSVISQVLE